MDYKLVQKYNSQIPRYTSYPTVPNWQKIAPSESEWIDHLLGSYEKEPALSLYIHLPFCEALCTYCACNKRITKNHQLEIPYIQALKDEWRLYLEAFGGRPKIKEIHLGGGTPTFFNASHLEDVLNYIIGTSEILEDHEFSFEAHPNTTNIDQLRTLYDIGFRRISIGVQDVSPMILKAINRRQTISEVQNLTKWARAIGYTSINYDIIYGLPFQKPSHILDTCQFISENKPDRIAFYSYAHVPWKSKSQRAFTDQDVPYGQEKFELNEIGRYLLEMEGYKSVGMDHFCLPSDDLYSAHAKKTMHRNFMGYTSRYTRASVALGCSSISDSWTAYVQNEKNVEQYQHMISNGKLPIIKGHILSKEELVMRRIILSLMCKSSVIWNDQSEFDLISEFIPNLEELEKDKLVSVRKNGLQVSTIGQLFVRNICAAIDPVHNLKDINNPIYSQAI